jgi:hypothetical protein
MTLEELNSIEQAARDGQVLSAHKVLQLIAHIRLMDRVLEIKKMVSTDDRELFKTARDNES